MFGSIFYNKFGLQYAPERLEEKEKFTYLHVQTYSKQTNKTSPLLIHYSAGFPDSQQSPTFSFFFLFYQLFLLLESSREKDRQQRQKAKVRKEGESCIFFFSFFLFMHYALVLHSFPNPSLKVFFLIFNSCRTGIKKLFNELSSLHLK